MGAMFTLQEQVSGFAQRFSREARRKRYLYFSRLLNPLPRPLKILDVGGTAEYWANSDLSALGDVSILLLNVSSQTCVTPISFAYGDACDLSRFADHEFDIVFSQSTLAYVKSKERMAREIRRVGKRYFVQTPNRHFPLDWRTLVPLFHLLPPLWQAWAFRHFDVGTYSQVRDPAMAQYLATRIRDLTLTELRCLFPGAIVVPELVCGFTKSWILHFGFVT